MQHFSLFFKKHLPRYLPMNIIFLEIHGVVATRDTDHRLSLEKLQKLNYLVSQTGARIVIASRYAFAEE